MMVAGNEGIRPSHRGNLGATDTAASAADAKNTRGRQTPGLYHMMQVDVCVFVIVVNRQCGIWLNKLPLDLRPAFVLISLTNSKSQLYSIDSMNVDLSDLNQHLPATNRPI